MKDYNRIEYRAYLLRWLALPLDDRMESEPLSYEEWLKQKQE